MNKCGRGAGVVTKCGRCISKDWPDCAVVSAGHSSMYSPEGGSGGVLTATGGLPAFDEI